MQKFTNSQHKKYMLLAIEEAKKSNDPHTHVGCVIVSKKGEIISAGYNHYPDKAKAGAFPTKREYKNKVEWLDTKYPYIIHAEANAIVKAKTNLKDCTLYVTLGSCYNCAKLIVDAGITHVYYIDDKYRDDPEFKASTKLFKACRVTNTKIKC